MLRTDVIPDGLVAGVVYVRKSFSLVVPARFIVWCRFGLFMSPLDLASLELSSLVCAMSGAVTFCFVSSVSLFTVVSKSELVSCCLLSLFYFLFMILDGCSYFSASCIISMYT